MEILNETTNQDGSKTYEVKGSMEQVSSYFRGKHLNFEIVSNGENKYIVKELSDSDL